jgi:hypothetical protein
VTRSCTLSTTMAWTAHFFFQSFTTVFSSCQFSRIICTGRNNFRNYQKASRITSHSQHVLSKRRLLHSFFFLSLSLSRNTIVKTICAALPQETVSNSKYNSYTMFNNHEISEEFLDQTPHVDDANGNWTPSLCRWIYQRLLLSGSSNCQPVTSTDDSSDAYVARAQSESYHIWKISAALTSPVKIQ